jgi:hypothetical protein
MTETRHLHTHERRVGERRTMWRSAIELRDVATARERGQHQITALLRDLDALVWSLDEVIALHRDQGTPHSRGLAAGKEAIQQAIRDILTKHRQ